MNTYVALDMTAIVATLSNFVFILGATCLIAKILYKSKHKKQQTENIKIHASW